MSWLFTIALLAICFGAVFTARKIHHQNASVTRRGPVPGYSFTPGAAVDIGDVTRGSGGLTWRVERLEEFHSPDRTRLILTLELESDPRDTDELRDALLELARALRSRASVDMVLVDAKVARLVFSPDGGGWSGEGDRETLFLGERDVG